MTRPTDTRVRRGGLQPVQVLAGLIGLIYLAIGIIGMIITGFGGFADATHSSLWVFSINPLHNVFHIVIGALGVLMALSSGWARTYGWVLLAVFGILLLWGLAVTGVFAGNPVSGLGNPFALDAADNWLHLGTALLGLVLAVMPAHKKVTTPVTGEQDTARGAAGRADLTDTAAGQGQGSSRRTPRSVGRRLWRRGTAH